MLKTKTLELQLILKYSSPPHFFSNFYFKPTLALKFCLIYCHFSLKNNSRDKFYYVNQVGNFLEHERSITRPQPA